MARRKGELLYSEGEGEREGGATRGRGYARTGSDIDGASGWWYAGAACVGICACEWKCGRGKERMMVDKADLRWCGFCS